LDDPIIATKQKLCYLYENCQLTAD